MKTNIPQNLEECFLELQNILPPEGIRRIKESMEGDLVQFHVGLGTSIRNNWKLWGGSYLAQFFNEIGISNPDDMTSIIILSFHRRLNGKDIKLKEQIEYLKEY